jgi:hypothetical protein
MKHDTNYYGGEILNLINKTLECEPSMDRGGTYIWIIDQKVIYCDMKENDYRGCLEVHENRQFKGQLDYNGILIDNEDDTDYLFTEDRERKIVSFLNKFLKTV